MASYSTNANVQNLVYGTTNTDLDAASTAARDVSTSIINSKLGLKADLSTVPDPVARCATLLAAGIISSSPDKLADSAYYKQGLALLDALGDESVSEDTDMYPSIHIEGFGRYENVNDGTSRVY